MLGGSELSVFIGGMFVLAGGMFVSSSFRASWLAPLFNAPPRGITPEESAELFGRGFTRAVFVGLLGIGLVFGGWVRAPGFLLPAGIAGVIALLVTRESR